MSDKQYRTVLWTIVIIFLVIAAGGVLFVVFYNPAGSGGSGVRIGILDSGINTNVRIGSYRTARELEDKIVLSENFATTEYGFDEDYTIVDDTEGYHGTVVALQIAGRTAGIAPDAELVIARCVDSEGIANYESVLAAFRWAVEVGEVDIINISLGGEVLVNDTLVEEINRATLEEGVLTVISAGNSGDGTGYSLSTINGPGDALQAITVGAYDAFGIAPYSSIGPLKDHSIKPDLVDTGFSINAIGTSFASPKIAAKAALLMSWAKEQGFLVNPGLLKAALMKSTENNIVKYFEHYGGAGVPNVEEAKNIILGASVSNNLPIVTTILPSMIPFEIETIFSGDIWSFPLTVVSSLEQTFTIITTTDASESIIDIAGSVDVNQTAKLDCKLKVPNGYTAALHEETIELSSSLGETLRVNVSIEQINEPILRIGFDTYHSVWQIDNLLGQFVEMRNYLADESTSLVELTSPDNYTDLSNFDGVIVADPNTYGIAFNESEKIELIYRQFENDTITSLINFVNSGKGLMVFTTDNSAANLTEANKLLSNFNITADRIPYPVSAGFSFEGNTEIATITNLSSTHPVTSDVDSIDYHGATLNITGSNAVGIAWGFIDVNLSTIEIEEWRPLVAIYETPTPDAGRVLVTGSNFMIDNWGVNNEYEATDNLDFLYNAIEWVTNSTLSIEPLSATFTNTYDYNIMLNEPTTLNNFQLISMKNSHNTHVIISNLVIVDEKKRNF